LATPLHDEYGNELLPDEEYARLRGLSPGEAARLPEALKKKLHDTGNYHLARQFLLGTGNGAAAPEGRPRLPRGGGGRRGGKASSPP
jgi:hypothetical protein